MAVNMLHELHSHVYINMNSALGTLHVHHNKILLQYTSYVIRVYDVDAYPHGSAFNLRGLSGYSNLGL